MTLLDDFKSTFIIKKHGHMKSIINKYVVKYFLNSSEYHQTILAKILSLDLEKSIQSEVK